MNKRYERNQLEDIAEDFLSKYSTRNERRLDIAFVIERYGWKIVPISGLSEIAEAYVSIIGKRLFVDEEQYMSANSCRYRFTLAEELAHILIHYPWFEGKPIEECVKLRDSFTDQEYLRIEQDAKFLAGCILLRREEFKARFSHHFEIQSQRHVSGLRILRETVRQLNLDFDVSRNCIALRALKLDLIDQNQMDELSEFWSSQRP